MLHSSSKPLFKPCPGSERASPCLFSYSQISFIGWSLDGFQLYAWRWWSGLLKYENASALVGISAAQSNPCHSNPFLCHFSTMARTCSDSSVSIPFLVVILSISPLGLGSTAYTIQKEGLQQDRYLLLPHTKEPEKQSRDLTAAPECHQISRLLPSPINLSPHFLFPRSIPISVWMPELRPSHQHSKTTERNQEKGTLLPAESIPFK